MQGPPGGEGRRPAGSAGGRGGRGGGRRSGARRAAQAAAEAAPGMKAGPGGAHRGGSVARLIQRPDGRQPRSRRRSGPFRGQMWLAVSGNVGRIAADLLFLPPAKGLPKTGSRDGRPKLCFEGVRRVNRTQEPGTLPVCVSVCVCVCCVCAQCARAGARHSFPNPPRGKTWPPISEEKVGLQLAEGDGEM